MGEGDGIQSIFPYLFYFTLLPHGLFWVSCGGQMGSVYWALLPNKLVQSVLLGDQFKFMYLLQI